MEPFVRGLEPLRPLLRLFVPVAQMARHLVEGCCHRRRFGAPVRRKLPGPVARCNLASRLGDVFQRTAHSPAERHATGEGQREGAEAGQKELTAEIVQKLLRRPPVLQQDQPADILRRAV